MSLLLTAKEYTEQNISAISANDFLNNYNISTILKKLHRAEVSAILSLSKSSKTLSKIKMKRELARIFCCNSYLAKTCQLDQVSTYPKAIPKEKRKQNLFFLLVLTA